MARVQEKTARVDHWRTSDQKLRWYAAALLAVWDSTLAQVRPRYWDVLSYHQYPQIRASEADLIAALNEVLASETDGRVRDYVRPLFGSMPIIITEADPGSGSARPETSMVGTLYGGIWAAEYAARLSTLPQVWHVGMHQLIGPAGIDLADDHRMDEATGAGAARGSIAGLAGELYLSAQASAYSLAAEAINAATASYRTRVTGGGTAAARAPGRTIPAVFAQAYRTAAGTTLLVTNKGSRAYQLAIVLNGKPVGSTLHAELVTGPGPDAWNSPIRTSVVRRDTTVVGTVSIPAWSVSRVTWP